MSFEFIPQTIPAVVLVRSRRHGDDRGVFQETFRRSAFTEGGITAAFVQDNLVHSGPGVLRGLHYQLGPAAQGKLVHVVRGRIFDVAVDLRRGSPTYRRHVACELSGDDGAQLWIPPGFAHGYAVLGDGADVAYKVTAEYAPHLDRGVRWNDPDLAVDWPVREPTVSAKDADLPFLADAELP
jgi:dTDP-4-dehydrorhamnose 3,5-epimerase